MPLLPADHGPVEVDMSGDLCLPAARTPTLRKVAQLQEVAKGGDTVSLVTLKDTRGSRGPVSQPPAGKFSPDWGQLISTFNDFFPEEHPGCLRTGLPGLRSTWTRGASRHRSRPTAYHRPRWMSSRRNYRSSWRRD
jgi:hypothetical protein